MVQRDDYIQIRREQAYVKHYVLKHYLQKLALKIGNFRQDTTLNYIDGFSGPWQQATEDMHDTSPHIALTELHRAREVLAQQKEARRIKVRAMFVESDPDAFVLLQRIPPQFPEIECKTYPGEFERHIEDARQFAKQGPNSFAFIFIDPTGWTGYGLQAITPLLKVTPGEVLINFMTKDITRFVDDGESTALQSFVDLFGDAQYRDAWRGMAGLDREDAIVTAYCDRVLRAGDFKHCCSTVILNTKRDRTHYHLVYATRSLKGLIAFRDTERTAIPEQREIRADAKQRDRVAQLGQLEIFGGAAMETSYVAELQARYQQKAHEAVMNALREQGEVAYDALIATALRQPMTGLGDLRGWIKAWRDAKQIEVLGLKAGERSPADGQGHRIRLRSASLSR